MLERDYSPKLDSIPLACSAIGWLSRHTVQNRRALLREIGLEEADLVVFEGLPRHLRERDAWRAFAANRKLFDAAMELVRRYEWATAPSRRQYYARVS